MTQTTNKDTVTISYDPPSTLCVVARTLDRLDEHSRVATITALSGYEDSYPSQRISNALTRHGHRVSAQSVAKHRRGLCCCQLNR